jgi:sterol desaturase/sphingolipid hydroxylase (fatty acid hydroxylase superfamily)
MNTKTYFVVVFGVLSGLEIDLLVVLLTGIVSMSCIQYGAYTKVQQVLGLPCFSVLFYCEHRLGHCPAVYAHAHKMHHYLHDTTSFDAHVYGSGMNEEFFWVLAEIIPCLLAPATMFPYALNLGVLYTSWENKGSHTRTSGKGAGQFYDDDNWHADHHTLHRKNFGSGYMPLLDFYFNTHGSKTTGTMGNLYVFGKEGAVEANKIQIRFEKMAPADQ